MTQGREKSMVEKRQILIELRKGSSIRKISRKLHVHRDIIRSLAEIANAQGWLHPDSEIPTEEEMLHVIHLKHKPAHVLDNYLDSIRLWRQEGYTAVVIRRLIHDSFGFLVQIGALRRYIRRHFPKVYDPVMVRRTIPGATMDVDFGFLGLLWDEKLGKKRKAWVFSARLRHSRKTYRRIVQKQDLATFLMCHIYAFEHFNGVPEEVVLDNLKAGVIQSSIDNDKLNPSYYELAEYYAFRISPCLPRTPEHKGGVENDINFIKRNFWPEIREKLKNQPKFSFCKAQEAIEKWDREVANIRKIGGINRSPDEIFQTEEKATLKALPTTRWELSKWLQCTVGRDWRVVIDGSYYSVPYGYIGQTVHCRVTHHFVHIYFEGSCVAKHPKASSKGEYHRNHNHAPPFKEAVLNCTRDGLLENAKEIGPNTYILCEKILSDPRVDKLRPVRSILSLAISYEKGRLENACRRALAYKNTSYASVKNILENGLDFEAEQIVPYSERVFKYARDPKEFVTTHVKEI